MNNSPLTSPKQFDPTTYFEKMPLNSLPNEILHGIVKLAYDSEPDYQAASRFILTVGKCSKRLNDICAPILYGDIILSDRERLRIFTNTIAANFKLASFVRYVNLRSIYDSGDDAEDYSPNTINTEHSSPNTTYTEGDHAEYSITEDYYTEDNEISPLDFIETGGRDLALQATRVLPFWTAVALLICLVPNIVKLELPSLVQRGVRHESATTKFSDFISKIVEIQNTEGAPRAPLSVLNSIAIGETQWYWEPKMCLKDILPFLGLKSLTRVSIRGLDKIASEIEVSQAYLPILHLEIFLANLLEPALIGFLSRFKCLESLSYQSHFSGPEEVVRGVSHLKRSLKSLSIAC
ncbi:hypothetical protein NHQ30_002784 [Ciborinia camelliae]|nr:hypothetical protein NHQ30_002784 [Ciborinia camelliae]